VGPLRSASARTSSAPRARPTRCDRGPHTQPPCARIGHDHLSGETPPARSLHVQKAAESAKIGNRLTSRLRYKSVLNRGDGQIDCGITVDAAAAAEDPPRYVEDPNDGIPNCGTGTAGASTDAQLPLSCHSTATRVFLLNRNPERVFLGKGV
jgi:hypothetical protein